MSDTDVTAADDVGATQFDIYDVTTDRSTSVPHSKLLENSLNFIREFSAVSERLTQNRNDDTFITTSAACQCLFFCHVPLDITGPDSSVCVAIRYGPDGQGIESQ